MVDLIERQGRWLGRWIDDYDAVLTGLRDAWTPDLGLVPGADTRAQAQEMLHRFLHARGETGERSRYPAVVNYLLTEDAPTPPGIGSFDTMTMHGTTAITGRPIFAASTKAGFPTPPMQHRRHVSAWHNIRDLLNRAYATHDRALISYLETKPTDVHAGMSAEPDGPVANMLANFSRAGLREAAGRTRRRRVLQHRSPLHVQPPAEEPGHIDQEPRTQCGELPCRHPAGLPCERAPAATRPC
ncbi:hypothetical protein AADR41_29680 [Streptomyces sp. CLV115]|uniref:hypothetical protein n=1 Tax=Streptomyces sp. CLV115 TaxID=3138502 RepID=UPI00313D6C7D